jgi:hypothetical protein
MLQTFVEKNRRLLQFYYWAARIGGWVFLIIIILAAAGHFIALVSRLGDREALNAYLPAVPWGMFNNLFPTAVLILGVAQLIRFLLDIDYAPGWILRQADKLLYIYTTLLIGYYCLAGFRDVTVHYNEPYDFPLRLIFLVAVILLKLFVLVGLAQMIKRLLPVIEESRTLV